MTRKVLFRGETIVIGYLADRFGMSINALRARIDRGMPVEEAVTAPFVPGHRQFNPEQVKAIRAEYATGGISQEKLGRKYGTSQTVIGLIIRRKTYRQVP